MGPSSTATTSPGAVPAGSITSAPRGIIACLRFAARSASGSKRMRRAKPAMIRAIFCSMPSSSSSSTPAKRATISAVRSSAVGPSPPLVTISRAPLVRHEAQAGLEVVGAVADDEDVRDLDAELGEALRDPGTVAVADPGRDHLGAGHEDPRAHARGRGGPLGGGIGTGLWLWLGGHGQLWPGGFSARTC